MTPERFPARMRGKRRWLCWYWGTKTPTGRWIRFERESLVPNDGHLWHVGAGGELTRAEKLPVCARDARRAGKVNDPDTWATFQEALDAVRRGEADGCGYVLDAGEAMVDLDGCVHGGDLDEFARACVSKLDSYAEFSVSGEGVHIIIVADGFTPDRGYKGDRAEVYVGGHTNRYCTVTGDVLEGRDELNEDAEDVLADLYEAEFANRPTVSDEDAERARATMEAIAGAELDEGDERAVAWMCGHYKWGRAMFGRGDFTGWARDRAIYSPGADSSQSAADAALASYLLCATGGDAATSLALLCRSGMWRPKYDEIHDGRHAYSVMTVGRVAAAIDVRAMRAKAIANRDTELDRHPDRHAELVALMRRDDVTDRMLGYVMTHHATGAARRSPRELVRGYPQEIVTWIVKNWEGVSRLAYRYDFNAVRR